MFGFGVRMCAAKRLLHKTVTTNGQFLVIHEKNVNMMLAAVILSLVALSAAQSPGCCTPNQWEGVEGTIGGYATSERDKKPGLIEGYTLVHYDADNQRVAAATNTSYAGKSFSVKAIYDFKNGMRYYIYDNKCRSLKLRSSFRKACIPSDAKLSEPFHMGAGDHQLNARALRYDIKKGTLRARAQATFSQGCIPFSEEINGRYMRKGKGRKPILASFLEVIGFVNIYPGIKDPSVFTPPKSCDQVHEEDFEEPEVFANRKHRFFGGF